MDNTTTYNTVIDVEVTGQEQVNELGDSIEQSDDKFKSLRAQIRETTVALQKLADEGKDGTKEFEALRQKLDELNDAQEKVGFQAGQFDDQLASLPGPLGAAGGAIKTFNEGLNRFSTGFKVAFGVVTLIVGAFLALKESLSRTEEGQAKLNKISEAFEKIMNAVFAVLEPIAMALADLVIGLLESETVMNVLSKTVGVLSGVFTGLFGTLKAVGGFIIGTLVNNFKTLIGVAKGAGDVIAGVFTFDWERIKKGADAAFTAVKDGISNTVDNVKEMGKGIATSVTDGFKSAEKSFKDGSKRMTAAEKEAAEKAKKEKEERDKKNAEDAKKNMEAAQKVQTEAMLALLDEREAELKKRETKFLEDRKTLLRAGVKDLSQIEAAYAKDVLAINKKFDDDYKKREEERLAKLKTDAQKGIDERVAAIDLAGELITKKTDSGYKERIAVINSREKELLANVQLTEADLLANIDSTGKEILTKEQLLENKRKSISETAAAERAELSKSDYDSRIQLINDKEKELLANVKLTEADLLANIDSAGNEIISKEELLENKRNEIAANAAAERATITKDDYASRIQAINDKEKELLSNVNLTESEINAIIKNASDERAAVEKNDYASRIQAINEKEKELLSNVNLTESEITAIIKNASDERAAIDREDYDARIQLVNEKEKELLSNAYLTESERTKIKLEANDARTAINNEAIANDILTNDNAFQQQLMKDASNYDALIALTNEKELLLLSNTELTEAQRNQIQMDAAAERGNIRATELEEKLLSTENDLAQVGIDYDRRLQLTNEKEALLLQQAGLTEAQKTAIVQQAANERTNIMLAEKQARADIQMAEMDLIGGFGSFLREVAGKNKKIAIAGVIVEQAAAIGKILVNTGIANAKAVAASPLTFGMPWVAINSISAGLSIASSVVAGAKAIQQIKSADSGGSGGGGGQTAPKGGGAGGPTSVPEPKLPTVDKAKAPGVQGTMGGSNPSSQIAQTIAMASGKPIKAYVVSGDVTSQQALDRRTSTAATFSG